MCPRAHKPKRAFHGSWAFYVLFLVLCFVFCSGPAWAHKVTIFAWVEGDTVHTQSKFSGGKRAQNSTVVVYDKEGKQLLEGKTDENGEFSFKVPKKTDLMVALKASMGHLAEWTIPVEEITAAMGGGEVTAPETDVKTPAQEPIPPTEVTEGADLQVSATTGLSRQEIQDLIDRSLDRKLTPIVNMLAESLESGPTAGDVIGGIGYIFGLVGVALYFTTRGKKK